LKEIQKEATVQGSSIGTTRKGIGPAYSSKAQRDGIRVLDLFKPEELHRKFVDIINDMNRRYDNTPFDEKYITEQLEKFQVLAEKIRPFVVDGHHYIHEKIRKEARVLAEGANAIMLDLDFGTYPFVTSSSTCAGGICTGLGIPPKMVGTTIGVIKAYTTRVGGGPFPTEQKNHVGEHLQEVGREWGTTTGRRRRCGWLDLVVMKYSNEINGYDFLNLTKLDILDELDEIEVGVEYLVDGKPLASFPADLDLLAKVTVKYEKLKGWKKPIKDIKFFDDLPKECIAYVDFIEKYLGVPIKWIGVGPGRHSMIEKGKRSRE